jgi:hypothetical protein
MSTPFNFSASHPALSIHFSTSVYDMCNFNAQKFHGTLPAPATSRNLPEEYLLLNRGGPFVSRRFQIVRVVQMAFPRMPVKPRVRTHGDAGLPQSGTADVKGWGWSVPDDH